MSTTKNLTRTVHRTAWIVRVDAIDKSQNIVSTITRRAFLDLMQAREYCEEKAALWGYKWNAKVQEWRSDWRRDGDMRLQYQMYIADCPLEQPVDQQEVKP